MSMKLARKPALVLWNILVSSGLASSPQMAVEQIACLILIKYLEHLRLDTSWTSALESSDPASYLSAKAFRRLRYFEETRVEAVKHRPDLNGLFSDAYFQLESTKPEALLALLRAVDRLFNFVKKETLTALSAGEVFDDLLSLAAVGNNALNITPARLSRFIVSLLDPKPGERLIDPAVGTARLLLDAEHYMETGKKTSRRIPVGLDVDKSAARIGWVSMFLHKLNPAQLHTCNSVSGAADSFSAAGVLRRGHYDIVLSDLPLGNVSDDVHPSEAKYLPRSAFSDSDKLTRRLELLFVWRTLDLLKVKGRAALIVPQSVLNGSTRAQRRLRRELLTRHVLEAIVLLPSGALPQVSTPMAVLVFKKGQDSADDKDPDTHAAPRTDSVWFYEVGEDENDLYDALVHFRQRNKRMKSETYYQPLDETKQAAHGYIPNELVVLSTCDLEVNGPGRHFMSFFPRQSTVTKQWRVPVREWLSKPDRQDFTGQVKGSHGETHKVRPDYASEVERRLYVDGVLRQGYLAPHCIEANNWSLDINDYRWPEAPRVPEGVSTIELIDELRTLEKDILDKLDDLRSLLEAG